MTAPTILRIKKLTNLGALGTLPPPDMPRFRRYNLIYGFNGTGKTTLSRVFASLEAGKIDSELPEGGQFELELSDGSALKSNGELSRLSGRVLVFNTDFQERNLQWKSGTAKPVFVIGQQQAENVRALERTTELRQQTAMTLEHVQGASNKANEAFERYKRDAARAIAEALGYGRRYNATNLDAETRALPTGLAPLSEPDAKRIGALANQEEPLPRIDPLPKPQLDLYDLCTKAENVLEQTIGELELKDFDDHPSMLAWAEAGLSYHRSADLENCLFCGGELRKDRLKLLSEVINDRFSRFASALHTLKERCGAVQRQCERWPNPSLNDLSPSIRDAFAEASSHAAAHLQAANALAGELTELIDAKLSAPNLPIDLGQTHRKEEFLRLDEALAAAVLVINTLIEAHNREHEGFREAKLEAKRALKDDFLLRGSQSFFAFDQEVIKANRAKAEASARLEALLQEEGRLRREVRTHGPAADLISKALQAYLGRSDLDIHPIDDGYQLRRNGKAARGPLSEGERTAIALCYFLITVKAEARKVRDLIVVIDDPVSSLDTRALNYSFNFIRSALQSASQLFILTHNLTYMNQVKKWLKNKARAKPGEEPSAALFFLQPKRKSSGEARSTLVELPKHIRDYDSEYQYLFSLAKEIDADPLQLGAYLYVMPNALRKVLDVFLAFKLPGADGLGSKIDALARNAAYGLDPHRIRALESLVQVESHADDLEELVAFSSMTVEEVADAAAALLHLMEKVDGEHYRRLCDVCA